MAESTVTFTEQAKGNLENMINHCYNIGDAFGYESDEYKRASRSFMHSLNNVIRLGGKISAEDTLGLYGVSFIDYGVVFHRHGDPKMNPVNPDQFIQAGEWSVHS